MKQPLLLIALLLLLRPAAAAGQTAADVFEPFSRLLAQHVVSRETQSGGRVAAFDYRQALDDPRTGALLDSQDARLDSFQPATLNDREQALAFWINAYNYFIIAHVLRDAADSGELVDGVKDFGSLFRPLRIFKRERFAVGGEPYSLDDIEKGILFGDEFRDRGWFDARVHFAVNCASVGCPPLRDELYRGADLDTQLDDNTRRALATELHLRIAGDTAYWSSLFDWYADDFRHGHDSVRAFVSAHVPAARAAALAAVDDIETIDYDWRLNRPGNFEVLAGR